MVKVCKFGGTSMATADSIRKVAEILLSDKERRFVIVSAPGKRFSGDDKVTDLLYASFNEAQATGDCSKSFKKVEERFVSLQKELGIKTDLKPVLKEIKSRIDVSQTPDYAASRGEYLSAVILSEFLGFPFVDAKDIIRFTEAGAFNADYSNDIIVKKVKPLAAAVIPGFYGSKDGGEIVTFSRGGSDVTGAIIARGVAASVYENWTDVDGFMTADPRIVDKPRIMRTLSYTELRELAYMGANVLHPESIFPVNSSGIPINIKNTFNPSAPGTFILPESTGENIVTGIAGKKGFTVIGIEKSMMNSEVGFARRILSVLEHCGICFEHMPSGIDTLSLVIADTELQGKMQKLTDKIREAVNPDLLQIHSGLSLIATVGQNMASRPGTAAALFGALAEAGINVKMIDQGSSELNIIVGVETVDYERAINAVYDRFFR